MSIPPVPNHPPRPGRRKPAEESPDSITTQLFIGQDKSAAADGSTQALTTEELTRLRSMVATDGAEATEVLSLDELRQLAAADGHESEEMGAVPRKVSSEDLAEAEAASAPKQWNPDGAQGPVSHSGTPHPQAGTPHPHSGAQQSQGGDPHTPGGTPQPNVGASAPYQGTPHPHQGQWVSEFGAAGTGPRPGAQPYPVPTGSGGYSAAHYGQPAPAATAAGSGGPGGFGPGGPSGPGGSGGPGGPGGPHRRQPETQKVPTWLWVLAAIALVLALGIVGYIVWDSMQGNDETTSAGASPEPSVGQGSESAEPSSPSSEPPVAEESFASPSGNIACTIDADRARCVIKDYDFTPPEKPDDCQLDDWGAIVVANKEGAGFSCREAPETNGPARVLGYGESVSAQGMTCTSTEEGMTCKSDETGAGFTVRRASVDFLD